MRCQGASAVRKVVKGAAKIYGHTYKPCERFLPYDGRLDGKRMLFQLYALPGGAWEPFVALWGTEAAAGKDPDLWTAEDKPEEVDGSLPWMTWHGDHDPKPHCPCRKPAAPHRHILTTSNVEDVDVLIGTAPEVT